MAYRTYSPSNGFLVNKGGQGDFTSITAAMAVATSGTVVYLAPAEYNESFVMPAGVTLTSLPGSGDIGSVIINGTITISAAGNYSLSYLQLQASSSYSIVISGAAIVNVFIDTCTFISVGAYSLNFSNSNATSQLLMYNCIGDILTAGSAHFSSSCPGIFYTFGCDFNNTIASTAAILISAGTFQNFNCFYNSPIITSGTAQFACKFCDYFSISTPCLTLGGSGNGEVNHSYFKCNNSAVPIVVNTILTTDVISVNTQGAIAIGGTGTLIFGVINIVSNGVIANTITQTDQLTYIGQIRLGSNFVVPNGGTITLQSGSTIQVQSGATLNLQAGAAIDIPLTGVLIGHGAGNGVTASAITQYDILVGGASNAISSVGPGTAGQLLQSAGNAANPAYSTTTYPSTNAINTLLYASSANVMSALATATTAVLTTSAGVPTWATNLSLTLGGTNASLTASNGGIFYSTASAGAILSGTSTASQVLLSGASTTPAWSTATYPSTATTGDIIIATGSNALGSLAAVAAHQVLASAGTSTAPAYTAYPQVSGLGIGASAGSTAGITFDGSSWMNAYSVGTWTPTITGSSTAGTTSYSTQTGSYVKIGRLVFIQGYALWTAATGTGTIALGGLPYAPTGSPTYQQAVIHSNVAISTATAYDCSIQSSSNILIGGVIVSTGALVASSLAANQSNYIYVTACYES